MTRYVVGLGSCQNQALDYIQEALVRMGRNPRLMVHAHSPVYRNPAKDTLFKGSFYNAACAISTKEHPHGLWQIMKSMEQSLGRIRAYPNGPRTLDLDLLLALQLRFQSTKIHLPHEKLLERAFFIRPCLDVLKMAHWPTPWPLLKAQAIGACGKLQLIK